MTLKRLCFTLCLLPFFSLSLSYADQCRNLMRDSDRSSCYSEKLKSEDGRLNQLYKEKRAVLDDKGKKELRDLQRSWIKFRDADCAFRESLVAENDRVSTKQACIIQHTQERANALATLPSH